MYGIITNVKYVLVGLLSVALFSAGWIINGNRWEAKYTTYQNEIEKVTAEQKQKNDAIVKEQKLITQTTKETYETKLSAINSYYSRLRLNPSSGSVPSLSKPTTRTNAVSKDLVLDCAITTQQLMSLQDWIDKQGKEYGNND